MMIADIMSPTMKNNTDVRASSDVISTMPFSTLCPLKKDSPKGDGRAHFLGGRFGLVLLLENGRVRIIGNLWPQVLNDLS